MENADSHRIGQTKNNSEAWDLGFNSGRHAVSYYYRFYGQSVRPVQGFTK